MRFTVAISARNGMPYLSDCLKSVLEASEGLDVEVFYEDAVSSDGSAECARRILGDSRVNVQNDEGFGDALNRVFRKSTGDVLSCLGADDMLAPHSLRHVEHAFASNPDAQWAVGLYQIIGPDGMPTRHLHTNYKNFAIQHFSRSWLFAENIVPHVSFFIRREFRAKIGDILNEKETISNDYDYFLRCVNVCPPLIIPEVLGIWRYHATSQSGSNMRRMSWDAWTACRKNTSNPFLISLNALCSLRNALLFHLVG